MTFTKNTVPKNLAKKIFFVLKACSTLFLCYYIISHIDWTNLQKALENSSPYFFLVVFALMLLNITISALKWKILLQPYKLHCTLAQLTKYYMTTMFFNNFMPGNIGGDAYRIFKIYKNSGSKACAFIPVFIERFTGLAILLILGFFASLPHLFQKPDNISRLSFLLGSGGIVLITLLVFPFTLPIFHPLKNSTSKIGQYYAKVFNHISIYRKHPTIIVKALLVSAIFYGIMFLARFMLISALGETCSITGLIMVLMTSTLLAMLPISINGYGVLDGSFIYMISKYGVMYESAVMVMILHRTLMLLVSLIGGYFYYTDKTHTDLAKFSIKKYF